MGLKSARRQRKQLNRAVLTRDALQLYSRPAPHQRSLLFGVGDRIVLADGREGVVASAGRFGHAPMVRVGNELIVLNSEAKRPGFIEKISSQTSAGECREVLTGDAER